MLYHRWYASPANEIPPLACLKAVRQMQLDISICSDQTRLGQSRERLLAQLATLPLLDYLQEKRLDIWIYNEVDITNLLIPLPILQAAVRAFNSCGQQPKLKLSIHVLDGSHSAMDALQQILQVVPKEAFCSLYVKFSDDLRSRIGSLGQNVVALASHAANNLQSLHLDALGIRLLPDGLNLSGLHTLQIDADYRTSDSIFQMQGWLQRVTATIDACSPALARLS